jgi:hypothetical protein
MLGIAVSGSKQELLSTGMPGEPRVFNKQKNHEIAEFHKNRLKFCKFSLDNV